MGVLMIGLAGAELSEAERARIANPVTGGVLILSRNYQSRAQLSELTAAISEIDPQCIIAVDQEGGLVQRLKQGFTRLPAMAVLGERYQDDAQDARQLACDCARIIAYEIRQVGITLSFAPVMDLARGNSAIRTRAFSPDPAVVTDLTTHFVDTLHSLGVLAVGKHFPGHGSVEQDTHYEVAHDRRDYNTIYQDDMQPFVQLIAAKKLHALMTAHVIYPDVDDQAASVSKKWMHDILRQELGFDGMLFSDDLNMKGVVAPDGDGFKAILDAGCDMVLAVNDDAYVDSILARVQGDDAVQELCNRTTKRWRTVCARLESNYNDKEEYHEAVSRIPQLLAQQGEAS